MTQKGLDFNLFKTTAKAALQEAYINGVRNREDTESEDELWECFDILGRIVAQSLERQPQKGDNNGA